MGVCASDANFYGSRGEVKGHEAPEPRATIREIRDRLEDVFGSQICYFCRRLAVPARM
mgnify:CR=1 FL=1